MTPILQYLQYRILAFCLPYKVEFISIIILASIIDFFSKLKKLWTIMKVKKLWRHVDDQRWSPRGRPWPWPRRSNPWPWPRSLKSSQIVLFSVRGQHYFLNLWNFVGKRQKTRRNFANNFFVFLFWSMGVPKGGRGPAPPNWNFTNDKNVPKSLLLLQFQQFLFSIFCWQQ